MLINLYWKMFEPREDEEYGLFFIPIRLIPIRLIPIRL
jgi:hypothetical protein